MKAMFAIIMPCGEARLLGSLHFQKYRDFVLYVPSGDPAASEYEDRFSIVEGGLEAVREEYVLFLEEGAALGKNFLKRAARCIKAHPGHDVWNVAVEDARKLPLKTSPERLFTEVFSKGTPAPLSSFIFRVSALREHVVYGNGGKLLPLATVLSCACGEGIRRVRWERMSWTPSAPPTDPVLQEQAVRENLDFFHWTETFFREEYPLGTGEQLDLFAAEIAKLYPSYTPDELKEVMNSFAVSTGTVRRMRAASALKGAIKNRQKELL